MRRNPVTELGKMIPLSEAFATIDRVLCDAALPVETIAVHDALGRTVVADQASRLELPPFDKSAMDGYAVLADDERESYRLLELVPAGGVPTMPLEPGTATKVMTGAPVPEGTGKVIMIEQTSFLDGAVHVHRHGGRDNVCLRGEDVRVGDVILPAPAVLDAAGIGNLIACGITQVEVAVRPRVCILATGEEIVDAPEELAPGKIMNSNGPMLEALCRQHGMDVVGAAIVPDEHAATVAAIRDAVGKADLVLISGGVSVGDFDFVCQALENVGLRVQFNRVAVKPGKPVTFAAGPGSVVFGLPGNPVSVYMAFHVFVLRAVALLAGGAPSPRGVALPLAEGYKRRRPGRTAYVPCRLSPDGEVCPVAYHGSAHLLALLHADGFFVVPEDAEQLRAGQRVDVLLTGGALR
jgi:molybdopterin molybdotransferase